MPREFSEFLACLSLNQVLETVPSGLFLVNLDQRIVHWNAEAERITGYNPAEAVGRHCSFLAGIPCGRSCGLFNPELPKPLIGVHCQIRNREGRIVHLLKNVDSLRDASGEVIGGIESFIDITAQRQLERRLRRQASSLEHTVRRRTEELAEERSRLRSALDAMADMAYIAGADYRVVFMNQAMKRVFGDQTGRLCHLAFYGKEAICDWCHFGEVRRGRTVRCERQAEASGRIYEIIHSPLRQGEEIQKLAVFRDITERKEAERNLHEANRELDAFVHTVSHDLKTPLAPIIGFAELLRQEYGERLDDQGREFLAEIEAQGERMLALIEDLLALARVGRLEAPEAPVALGEIVAQTLEELRQAAGELPPVEVGALPSLLVPATLLHQVLANLIGNAVRYGGGSRIEVGSRSTGRSIACFVRDHGPGIPAGERERIFELFYRSPATAGQKPGTGLGLAIVRKIARLYGGEVRAEETPGGGSTFWVELPADLSPAGS